MDKPPFNIPDAASFEDHRIPVSLSDLTPSDRLKHHRKVMRAIAFNQGLDGVNRYKAEYPEAAPIRVNIATLAYSPKPKGYDQYLVDLVRSWLTSPAALASTNLQDVDRLNCHFHTTRFNPAKHFSERLSSGRLSKLKALFDKHGHSLDTEAADTMSRIRGAAKALHGVSTATRQLGTFGTISGNQLVMSGRSFTISLNGSRECVRIRISGSVRRFYLDELECLAGMIGSSSNDPLPCITLCNIGECDYSLDQPDCTPVSGENAPEILSCDYPEKSRPSDVDQSNALAPAPPSLTNRIAALRAALPSHSPTCPDGVDPLTL